MGDLTEAELKQLLNDIHRIAQSLEDISIAMTVVEITGKEI